MKRLIKNYLLLLISVAFITSCKKDASHELQPSGQVNIHFHPIVDALPLDFTTLYRNSAGEDYSIRTFRFYIHNIELINTDTKVSGGADANHYLVDAQNLQSTVIGSQAAVNTYNSIAFVIGVDSIRNVSGAQDGALDPAKGMFWTWSTGYIMAKFEGVSLASTQPGNRFEYHIGGFKGADNVVKRIQLDFPPGQTLAIVQGKSVSINITANANTWFDGNSVISIAATPVSMTPGVLSKQIAENYYRMFTVTDVENN